MVSASVIILVLALIAAALGFKAVAGLAFGLARIVFFLLLILFVVTVISGR